MPILSVLYRDGEYIIPTLINPIQIFDVLNIAINALCNDKKSYVIMSATGPLPFNGVYINGYYYYRISLTDIAHMMQATTII